MSFELGKNRYGKRNVRLLRVVKDSAKHQVHELTGQILLSGDFGRAYTHGDNAKVLPTETQKNTFYAMSKKYDVDPIEAWSKNVADDIMERHAHIDKVEIEIDRQPWNRAIAQGKEHDHTFIKASDGVRFVKATYGRRGTCLNLSSGFKDVNIMKTTQSGFEGFIKDEYTTLTDSKDRVMATSIYCEYTFGKVDFDRTKFNEIHAAIKEITIFNFSGPAKGGKYSKSVQQTLWQIGCAVLKKFGEIESISFSLPNIHFYGVDFGKFETKMINNNEVFFTFDGAHGLIEAEVKRSTRSKL